MKFSNSRIVRHKADGSADPVKGGFQERFNVSSTLGRALVISPVTVADGNAHGELSCELIDSTAITWKQAIQVQERLREGVPQFYLTIKFKSSNRMFS